jgi:1,4-dihydroxy-2-naphthoyl-CoA hydrolase
MINDTTAVPVRPGMTGAEILDLFRAWSPTGLPGRLGMEMLEVGADRTSARIPVEGNTQPLGLLHGGASLALAESVASVAATVHAVETQGAGAAAVGTSVACRHLRATRSGWVTATATPVHRGRSTAFYRVEIVDDEGRPVATVTVDHQILAPRGD